MGISAAVVGAAVVGGVASNSAASKQANAASDAADQQSQASAQMRQDLSPYTALGQQSINPLWAAMGYMMGPDGAMTPNPSSQLQQQFSFDPSNLQNTPGYQFTMQQGLRGVQNQMASQGLGLSGAQLKGAETYASGLANQTYGDQYNRALSTYNTNYQTAANNVNRLQALVNTGQNSGAQTGQAGIQSANNAGNYLTQAGNAQASGIMGASNAAQNGMQNYMMYNSLYGGGNSGGTPSSVNLADTFSGFQF